MTSTFTGLCRNSSMTRLILGHGGSEEQCLARERHQLADALDIRNEAHIEHAIGFASITISSTPVKQRPALENDPADGRAWQ